LHLSQQADRCHPNTRTRGAGGRFTGMSLCSDCDAMADFVKDEALVGECRKCCAQESKRAEQADLKFTHAMLEICQ
jgi:hypothetical protein